MKKLLSGPGLVSFISGTAILLFGLLSIAKSQQSPTAGPGPDLLPPAFQHSVGDPVAGKAIFRYETFGNQGFWTRRHAIAARHSGLRSDAASGSAGGAECKHQCSESRDCCRLNRRAPAGAVRDRSEQDRLWRSECDPFLIEQQAVIGVVVFDSSGNMKPPANTGTLNIGGGDKVGLTCAVCHAVTDNAVLAPNPSLKTRGSVGHEVDGAKTWRRRGRNFRHGAAAACLLSVAATAIQGPWQRDGGTW